jgi:hypothetical protein
MAESNQSVLSLGAFLVILVVAIVLLATGIIDLFLFVPVILVLSGCLLLGLAAFKPSTTQKYAPSAFYLLSSGLFLIAVGGAFYLLRVVNFLYSIALVLLVLGALAIAAALRRK